MYYLLADHLGSTGATVKPDGTLVARQLTELYGKVRYTTGTLPTDFGFTGQRLDDIGLMFYGARHYDPALGRFLSADTIVPKCALYGKTGGCALEISRLATGQSVISMYAVSAHVFG